MEDLKMILDAKDKAIKDGENQAKIDRLLQDWLKAEEEANDLRKEVLGVSFEEAKNKRDSEYLQRCAAYKNSIDSKTAMIKKVRSFLNPQP